MAINQNPSLPNRHTGYLAKSGYGKSQALKQNPALPKMNQGARVILWDPDRDHRASHHANFRQYMVQVREGLRSGKGFRLAFAPGDPTAELFERWCGLVWICLDGRRPLHIIIEELADVSSAGKASPMFGQVIRKARKYGGVIHWTSQRSEEISKTVFSQTENYWIGFPSDSAPKAQVDKLARIAGAPSGDALRELEPLQFYVSEGREKRRVNLKYKNF